MVSAGHSDPDTGTLVTYAPAPQSEGLMMFRIVGVVLIPLAELKLALHLGLKL